MRKLIVMVVGMLLVAAPVQAGGGGGGGLCSAFAEGATVVMLDSCFEGTAHFAPAGATLAVTNEGGFDHTFTAADGSFDSGNVAPGDTFEIAFDEPTIIRVFCSLHGSPDGFGMAGVVIVGEPTPEAVAAFDVSDSVTSAVHIAVAEALGNLGDSSGGGEMADALQSNTRAVNKLNDGQAGINQRLNDIAAAAGAPVPEAETATGPLTLDVGSSDWVPMAAGLGIGLGVAAFAGMVLVVGRSRQDDDGADPQLVQPLVEPNA